MSARPRLLGAVLAGGRSRRFGSDKAEAVVAGMSLVERAARTLAQVVDGGVVVVSSRGEAPGLETIPDLRQGSGPLGGIETALAHAHVRGFDAVVVLACDLPLVTVATVRALVHALPGVAAVAPERLGDPPVEPLCAVYSVECLEEARRLLDEGRREAGALFASVDGRVLALDAADFVNVNTPADREAAAAELLRRGSEA